MNHEINNIINKITSNRVLVIGDAILDCRIDGEVSGLSAEAPIVTFRERKVSYALGGATNVALNLKNAKQSVTLISVVGSDDNGQRIKSMLDEQGISSDGLVVDLDRVTTTKKRYCLEQSGQIFRSDVEDRFDISEQIEAVLVEKISQSMADADIVVLSDYLKGCLTRSLVRKVVDLAHARGLKVVVDPKDSDYTKYANCDVIKPNKKELALMMNKNSLSKEDVFDGCWKLCHDNGHQLVVTTLGAEGMFAYQSNGEHFQIDAEKTDVVDVVGAGDTAISYLCVGIASQMTLQEAVLLANKASGNKVSQHGTVAVKYADLAEFDKRVELSEIALLREFLHDKKVVFTNGCFDLLHSGHVSCLTQAKSFGDVLVVGINSDDSVARLKGSDRPIIKLEERIRMLEALSCVDYVIPFYNDTPIEVIAQLVPQVLVKGSEYVNKTVVGADIVQQNGGEVRFVDMYNDLSTSEIVKKIKQNNE